MKNAICMLSLLCGMSAVSSFALSDGSPVACGNYRMIHSKVLNEDRTVLIRLPESYDKSDKKYPSLYRLAGDKGFFVQTVSAVDYLVDMTDEIPDHIVVGIENTDRGRDMFPERGADDFIRFLEDELIPFVDRRYRTNGFKILCGQSTSSIFTIYAFLRRPDVFDAYILGSFGLPNESLSAFFDEELRKSSHLRNVGRKYLFVPIGKKDSYDPDGSITKSGMRFLDALRRTVPKSVSFHSKVYEEEGHVPFPSVYDGLRWIYSQGKNVSVVGSYLGQKPPGMTAEPFAPAALDYLGQPPPGATPEVFARGLVSTGHLEHSAPALSPDGNEVFWSLWRRPDKGEPEVIMTMRREGGTWSAPATAQFSGDYLDSGPVFSADGQRIYFSSKRPTEASTTSSDIWFVEKQGDGWSEPKCIGFVARFPELKSVGQPSITRDGTLYFISRQKDTPPGEFLIYRAELINGEYPKPEPLPRSVNAPDAFVNWTPFIAPDESYLLFSSGRRDRSGGGDLYIARRAPDGTWLQPEMLPESINTPKQDRFPAISPDGRYLFFVSETPGHSHDVYWVSVSAIPALRVTTNPTEEISE
jgi:predicted alpha/beta superfamily hydrolase